MKFDAENEKRLNDWELSLVDEKLKENNNCDLNQMYDHAHSELSLQQSKRDQIITIYLALCSFLLPFALGEQIISFQLKGIIFAVLGVIGILFSLIIVRYREYKEVYWLCCQTITVLQNFRPEEIDKSVIQRTFHHCLMKKGKPYLKYKGNSAKLKKGLLVKKNLFSAETMHFQIIAIMASFISGLGLALIVESSIPCKTLIGIATGLLIFSILLIIYFYNCMKTYFALESNGNDRRSRDHAFNSTFSKAWFLHFYYDHKS